MILYHVTPSGNLGSIQNVGLDWRQFGRSVKKGIWLAEAWRLMWARYHVARWHTHDHEDMAVLKVRISRSDLRRVRDGIWITQTLILPAQIKVVFIPCA